MNLGDFADRYCTRHGDRVAVIDSGRQLTYGQVLERSNRFANLLLGQGVQPGERVAVLVGNRMEWFEITFGTAKAGAVRTYLHPRAVPEELAYQLADSGASTLVIGPEFFDLIDKTDTGPVRTVIKVDESYGNTLLKMPAEAPGVSPKGDDLVALTYSSGTTGKPKGVMWPHSTMLGFINSFLLEFEFAQDDVMLHTGPMSHAAGTFTYPMMYRGAKNIILDKFDIESILDAIVEHRVTTLMLVPTMLYMLLEALEDREADTSSVRNILYGSSPIAPAKLAKAIERFGNVFQQSYGSNEAGTITALRKYEHDPDSPVLASAGQPSLISEVKLLDADGAEVPVGEVGEVTARGPYTGIGYWQRPKETAATWIGDGWVRTSDIGRFDENGYLYIVDRKADMIISGGFNVYPREVEDVLLSHHDVAEAVVIGIPDDKWGERVCAVVRPINGRALTDTDLDGWCREHLSGYKVPRLYQLIDDEFPKNAQGKVLRRVIREPFWRGLDRQVH